VPGQQKKDLWGRYCLTAAARQRYVHFFLQRTAAGIAIKFTRRRLKEMTSVRVRCLMISRKLFESERQSALFLHDQIKTLAGWRSADGQLHDYYFLWVNGIAIHYGLVPKDQANAIMDQTIQKLKGQSALAPAQC
jgi:hypothetical protein